MRTPRNVNTNETEAMNMRRRGPVGNGAAHQEAQARQLQQDQQHDDDQAGEGQKKERSGSGHRQLKHYCASSPAWPMRDREYAAPRSRMSQGSVSAVTISLYSGRVHCLGR